MSNPLYASGDFTCTWYTEDLSVGWGDDTFLTVTPNGPIKEASFGADGNMSVSKLADQGGTIEITFMQTAEALSTIDAISASEQLVGELYTLPFGGPFTFKDPTGNTPSFVAWNTVLIDKGVHTHQKVMGERTITFACEKLIFGDVDSITSNILDYIKS